MSAQTRAPRDNSLTDEGDLESLASKGTILKMDPGASLKTPTSFPKQMSGTFYGLKHTGVEIDQLTMDNLKENFRKFLPDDSPGESGDRLEPGYMKMMYEKMGLNATNPAMYNMVVWMTEAYENSEKEGEGLSFEEFI